MYFHLSLVAFVALISFKVDGLSVDNDEQIYSFNSSSVGPLEESTKSAIAASPKTWKILKIQPKVDIETNVELEKDKVDPMDKSKYKLTLNSQGPSKDKLSSWNSSRWSKLPIRPPKLRFGDKPIPTKSRRIAYGSVVRTRSLDKSEPGPVPMEYKNSSKSSSQDILQLSSSEKFSSSLRLTRLNVDSNDSKGSQKLSIPNLLAPKFPRPAMYSLNGYIPKPNIQRLSTTSPPIITKSPSNGRSSGRSSSFYARNEFLNDKHSDKDNEKLNVKKYRSKHEQLLDESTDLNLSGTVNRQLSKRRGYLTTSKSVSSKSSNQPTQHQQKYRLTKRKGEPGKDFPLIKSIPRTSFECKDQTTLSGYYADVETGCQVWHMCQGHRKHSFLCPRGTIFSQKSGVCDWWYNVDCQGVDDFSIVKEQKNDPVSKGDEMDNIRTKLSKNGKNIFELILSGKRRFL